MKHAHGLAALLLCAAPMALAQTPSASLNAATAGFAAQLELDGGGDDLHNSEIHASNLNLGQGANFAFGGFYRPSEMSHWEVQAFVGYKWAFVVPVEGGGGDANITRMTFHVVADYRPNEKGYVGGGLVYHINPRYYDDWPDALDVDFDNALGATVEAGWRWFALQYTFMKYQSVYGEYDASSYGLRFTWRFERPIRKR